MQISKKRITGKFAAFIVIFCLLQGLLAFVAVPGQTLTRIMMHDFYSQDEIDLVFLGASRVYRSIIPTKLDSALGTKSFNLSSGTQNMVDSYYLLKDLFKKHSPELVFIDVNWRRFGEKDPVGTMLPFIHMPLSMNKLDYLINAFIPHNYLGGLFPGLMYPDALLSSDILKNPKIKLSSDYRNYIYNYPDTVGRYIDKGYTANYNPMKPGNLGQPNVPVWEPDVFDEESILYFQKIVDLCLENSAQPIAFSPPVPAATLAATGDYGACLEAVTDIVSAANIDFANFDLVRPEFFDARERYFFDAVHMSEDGAEAFTSVLAAFIADYTAGLADMDKYLFDTYAELQKATSRVLCVWLEREEASSGFMAHSYTGAGRQAEFEFLFKRETDSDFTVLREYGLDPLLPLPLPGAGNFVIRVNARAQGSPKEYEQYFEMTYSQE